MEDRQIVMLFWARSEEAIAETQKKYGRYCQYIAYRILKNDADAEEVVSDTYLRLWNSIPPHRPDPLKPYVGTVCRRLALNEYERQNAQKRGGELPAVLEELSDCVADGDSASDMGESVALADALNRFLKALPSETRNIFVRRYWYTASVAEISESFHMKESTVAMLLLRTRRKLKKHLEKEGFTL
ncbi:MAG: sigma-70 family RNA polymerase sigma factor [Clostridia bacterium]|nr:sigma-70 family RNA polymerase sigma factor [Clostridia bacterium]